MSLEDEPAMARVDTDSEDTAIAAKTRPEGSILAVTSEPPWPLNSGGHLRTYHLLRALSSGSGLLVIPVLRGEESVIDPLERAGIIVRRWNQTSLGLEGSLSLAACGGGGRAIRHVRPARSRRSAMNCRDKSAANRPTFSTWTI